MPADHRRALLCESHAGGLSGPGVAVRSAPGRASRPAAPAPGRASCPAARAPSPAREPRWPLYGLAALLVFSSAISAHRICRDTVPMVADESGYYRTTVAAHRELLRGNFTNAINGLRHPGIRPPLGQVVTIGVYALLGEVSQRAARLSMLVFLWALLLATYGLGARLLDRPTGLIAAALLAGFPQVIGFSRLYWMDLPLAAITAGALWLLLLSRGLQRRGPSLLFGLASGLGLLTKYTFPVFVVGPLIALLWLSFRARRVPAAVWWRRLGVNVLLAAAATAAVCGPWYAPRLASTWSNFIYNQGVGVLLPRPVWTLENLALYFHHLHRNQIGLAGLVLLLVTFALWVRRGTPTARALLLGWIVPPYLFFTFLVLGIEWARFTLPYLPALALVMALGLMQFRRHLAARGLAAAAALVSVWLQVGYSFGPPPARASRLSYPWQRAGHAGLLVPEASPFYLHLPDILPPQHARGPTHVALFPDLGNFASLFDTWAMEQQAPLRFSVPFEPESDSFGERFTAFPARVADPSYLEQFQYMLEIVPPLETIWVRRPDYYERFRVTWGRALPRFLLERTFALPGRVQVHIYRNRALGPGVAGPGRGSASPPP